MITRSAKHLVQASNGDPLQAVATVGLFYMAVNILYSLIETLVWGDRFVHWFDVPTALAFIAYAIYLVWCCSGCQNNEVE